MKPILSPRELADALGVSESSVKRWVDGGAIAATKTAGGHRRIPVTEAVRFIRDKKIALIRPEALGMTGIPDALDGLAPADEAADRLFELLRAGEAEAARGMILSLYLTGRSVAQLVDDLLKPAMSRMGQLWKHDSQEECGIFWEHRATDIAISCLSRLRMLIPSRPEDAPVAVGGAPTGDPYILPSLGASAVLESQGWNAVNLGPDTPLASLLLAGQSVHAKLVWLSISVVGDPASLRQALVALLEALRPTNSPLIIGGSRSTELDLPENPLLHVGTSMRELDALVKGMRAAAEFAPPVAAPS